MWVVGPCGLKFQDVSSNLIFWTCWVQASLQHPCSSPFSFSYIVSAAEAQHTPSFQRLGSLARQRFTGCGTSWPFREVSQPVPFLEGGWKEYFRTKLASGEKYPCRATASRENLTVDLWVITAMLPLKSFTKDEDKSILNASISKYSMANSSTL